MANIVVRKSNPLAAVGNMSAEQVKLVKDTVCRGATDNELALFLYTAKQTGLDPLRRQIHAVKRWDSGLNREVMSIQTGIDGYRLLAERTSRYAPGPEPTFKYDADGKVVSATATVKKLVAGTWFDVTATALYSEYVARKKDGMPNQFWATKPHIMLGKCAEALALRRAFPDALSGIYTNEEMEQADNLPQIPKTRPEAAPPTIEAEVVSAQEVPEAVGAGMVSNPPGVAEVAPPPQPPKPSECISEPQRKRLFAILCKGAVNPQERENRQGRLKVWMQNNTNNVHTEQISRNDYEKVCQEAARIAGGQ